MEDQIKSIISSLKPGIEFPDGKGLVTDGLLTSLDIVALVAKLADEFDVEISVLDILPENFDSLEAIASLIKRLEDE